MALLNKYTLELIPSGISGKAILQTEVYNEELKHNHQYENRVETILNGLVTISLPKDGNFGILGPSTIPIPGIDLGAGAGFGGRLQIGIGPAFKNLRVECLNLNWFTEMVLKYRTENFCNFQSNETRNEYEEEVPQVRCSLQI